VYTPKSLSISVYLFVFISCRSFHVHVVSLVYASDCLPSLFSARVFMCAAVCLEMVVSVYMCPYSLLSSCFVSLSLKSFVSIFIPVLRRRVSISLCVCVCLYPCHVLMSTRFSQCICASNVIVCLRSKYIIVLGLSIYVCLRAQHKSFI